MFFVTVRINFARSAIISGKIPNQNKGVLAAKVMVKCCSAVNCSVHFGDKRPDGTLIPLHYLPADKDRRREWLAFLNRKELPKTVLICGDHFVEGKKWKHFLYGKDCFGNNTISL